MTKFYTGLLLSFGRCLDKPADVLQMVSHKILAGMAKTRLPLICIILLFWSPEARCLKSKIRRFPKNFMFGASTAAYQIEGGWAEDGKGMSIWDVMTHSVPSPIDDASTGDVAADSYHKYLKDVEIMNDLSLDFYRFSIAWTRILPSGFPDKVNELGVAYYNNLINKLRENNIQPVVTMYHWDLPEKLQKMGGWLNPNIVIWFSDYARVLFEKFGDRVQQWITINEPKQICYDGYGIASKAPMINMTGIAEYICAKNVLLAHAEVYHMYDEVYRAKQNGTLGISISFTWFEPTSDLIDDHQAAQDARQFDWGQYAHPIFSKLGDFPPEVRQNVAAKSTEQGFPRSRLPELTAKEVAKILGSSDFLGVNAYTTKMAYRDASLEGMYPVPSYMDDMSSVLVKDPTWPQAKSSWLQSVSWGFLKLLLNLKQQYDNPPVIITENGWSTAGGLLDDDRIRYLRSHLRALLDAYDQGCDIKGYSVWSLLDNFEWKHGYTEKFGLYEVDFRSAELTRTPRKSAFVYKEIIRSRTLDPYYEPDSAMTERQDSQEKTKDETSQEEKV